MISNLQKRDFRKMTEFLVPYKSTFKLTDLLYDKIIVTFQALKFSWNLIRERPLIYFYCFEVCRVFNKIVNSVPSYQLTLHLKLSLPT